MALPELFSPTGAIEIDPGGGPGFDTPLGRMVFVVSESGVPVDLSAAWRTGPYTVWQWANGVELLLNPRLAVTLPPDMTVAGAAAAIIRAIPGADRLTETACLWSPLRPAWAYECTMGDTLTGATWSNGTTLVTVAWPNLGRQLPARDNGYLLEIPSEPGRFQTHLVCAWGPARLAYSESWVAVDQQPEDLLAVAD